MPVRELAGWAGLAPRWGQGWEVEVDREGGRDDAVAIYYFH